MALSENEKRRFENRYRGIVDQKSDPFDALPDSVKARLYKRKSTLEKNAGDVPASKRKHIYSEFGTGVETEFRNNLPGLAQEYARKRAERERTLPLIGAGVYEAMTGNNMPSLALEYAQERAAQGYKRPSLKDTDFRNKVLENAFTGLQLSQMAMKGSPSAKDTAAEYMATKDSQSKRKPYTLRNTPYDQDLAVYTPPEVEEKRRREKFENVGFYDQNDEFVRYDGLERQSDFPEMVKSGKEKDNVFNANYGLIDYLNKDKRDVMKAANTNFTYMTDTEKDLYYYLNAKYGAKAASNYVESINKELNRRSAEYATAQAQKLGKEHPILGTVADTAFATVGSGAYPWIVAKTVAGKKEIDPNDPAFGADILNSGIRSGMSENETLKTLIPNEGARNFAIGTGLSMAENIGRLPMGYLGLGVAAGGAGLSATREATERGGTANQAIAYGAANAAAEAFFEKFSLENLKSLKAAPGKGVRIFLRNIGKQALTEGSEEVFTEIANTVSDQVIMRELSNYNLELEYYKSQGMSEEEAKQKAFGTFLSNVALAGAGGAVSGGLMGGGGQLLGNYELSQYGKSIDHDYRDVAAGIDIRPESYATAEDQQQAVNLQNLAQEYAARQANKETISNREKAEFELQLESFNYGAQARKKALDSILAEDQEPPAQQNHEPGGEQPDASVQRPTTSQNSPEAAQMRETAPTAQKSDSVAYNAPTTESADGIVKEYAKIFGKEGQKAFEALYDGETDIAAFSKSFGRAYDVGHYNQKITPEHQREAAILLGVDGFSTAYAAGARDRNAEIKYDKDTYEPTALIKGAPKEGGLGYVAPNATDSQKRWAMSVGKATGLQIDLVDTLENPNAAASYTKGKITLSINSSDFLGSASHELTHYIKDYSPELYQRYKDETIKALMEAKGVDLETLLGNYAAAYERSGQQLSRDELTDEIVADAAQSFFNDPEYINKIVSNNTIVGKKIVDWLTDVIDAIKQLIKTGSTRQAAKALEENLENLETARDIWMEALERAGDRYKAGWETDTDTKYQLNQFGLEEYTEREKQNLANDVNIICNSRADIKRFVENINPSKLQRLFLGNIGPELGQVIKNKTGIDITGYSLVIRSDNVTKIFKDHGSDKEYKRGQIPVTVDDIAAIPQIISEADNIERTTDTDMGKPAIRFEKNFRGKDVVIEYISDKRRMLYTQTMWINKKNPPTTEDVQAPSLTPEAVSGTDSNDSIPQDTNEGKVRFQIEDVDAFNFQANALQNENRNLKSANELLKKQLMYASKGKMRQEDIEKIARTILKKYSSTYDKDKMFKVINQLYEYIRSIDKIDGDRVIELATGIAKGVLEQSRQIDKEFAERYRDVKEKIRNTKIKISDQDKVDLAAVGGYNEFRKKYFGRMKLGNDGISIDSLYQELSAQHPEMFPQDITHPADQLMAVAYAVDQMKGQVTNPYHADIDEMAVIVGHEIVDAYFKVRSEVPVYVDRAGREIEKTKAEYQRQMFRYKTEIKEKYEGGIREAKKAIINERQKLTKMRNELIEKLEGGNLSEEQYKETKREIKELKERILDLNREDTQIKNILQPQKYADSMRRIRERQQRSRDKNQILRDTQAMQTWLLRPNNKKRVPDAVKGIVLEFLHSIDYSTDYLNRKGEKTHRTQAWDMLEDFYNKVKDGAEWTGEKGESAYFDCDPDMVNRLKELKQRVYQIDRLDDLTAYEMDSLKRIVSSTKKTIMEMNDLKANQKAQEVGELAGAVIVDLDYIAQKKWKKSDQGLQGRKEYGGITGDADKFLNYDNVTPYTMFWKMGKSMLSVYKSFRSAADQRTLLIKEAEDYVKKGMEDLKITKKELLEWTGKTATKHTFTVTGGTITLTPSQIMSLYETNKRGQGRKHIYGDGIENAPIISKGKSVGGEAEKNGGYLPSKIIKSYRPVKVTPVDVDMIISTLTPKQKQFADLLQVFLKDNAAEWGNHASVLMYGYKKFMSKDYFPIITDGNYLFSAEGDLSNILTTIRNLGMTKPTNEYANNAVIIDDIFDVFSRHVDQMSTYSTFLAPLSDYNKVYNFKDREMKITVKQEIERAMGKEAKSYLETLIRDINGDNRNSRSIWDTLLANKKVASVAGSVSVVIQQPSSYLRAIAEIDPKYLAEGALTKTREDQWDLICKYAPIAQWKDWGFYQMNVSRSLKDIMFHTDSRIDQINNFLLGAAQRADQFTWNRIWRACENEVEDRHKDLQPGTEEFYRQVGERFSEIIDKTQVVDSVLHRSQIMRKKDFGHKMVTAFMGEPTSSYNMLYRAGIDVQRHTQGAKGRALRVTAAFAATAALGAALKSIPSAWRDDDEEKDYWEKWLAAFWANLFDNVNPLNLIPLGKDITSIAMGYSPSRMDMQGFQDIAYAVKKVAAVANHDSEYTPQYAAVYAAKSGSGLFGLPVNNVLREAEGILRTYAQYTNGLDDDYKFVRKKYEISYPENRKRYASLMVGAEQMGDKGLSEEIRSDLIAAGHEEKDIDTCINGILKKQYEEDDLVKELAGYRAAGDMERYGTLFREMEKSGYQVKPLKSTINKLNKEEEETEESAAEDEEATEKVESVESIYDTKDLIASIEHVSNTTQSLNAFNAVAEDMLQAKIANGVKKSDAIGDIKGAITRKYKPQFVEAYLKKDTATREAIQNKLKHLKIGGVTIYGSKDWSNWVDEAKKKK